MFVLYEELMKKTFEKKIEEGKDPHNLEYGEIFKAMKEFLNKKSEEGYNLVCFVDDPILPQRYGFLFEKSDKTYEYNIVFLDEIMEEAYEKFVDKGIEYTNADLLKVLEENGVFTPMYFPSLRYVYDEDDGAYRTLPVYICRFEAKATEARKKLYAEYQEETKKNAIFRGKETKAFEDWLKSKE